MDQVSVSNFRSIRKRHLISINPITVFVGKNNSGKSTYMRVLPLLKQSTELSLSGPLLLSGSQVDFGLFEDLLHNTNQDDTSIINTFRGINDITIEIKKKIKSRYLNSLVSLPVESETDVGIKLVIGGYGYQTNMKEVKLSFASYSYKYDISDKSEVFKVLVNNQKEYSFQRPLSVKYTNTILPTFDRFLYPVKNKRTKVESVYDVIGDTIASELLVVDKDVSKLNDLILESRMLFRDSSKQVKKMISERLSKIGVGDNTLTSSNIIHITLLMLFLEVHDIIARHLRQVLSNVHYIGPNRSSGARYYPLQNVNVSEIKPDGSNLYIYINSLKQDSFKELQDFIYNHMRFTIERETDRGFASLFIIAGEDGKRNIADAGYGYSQILPILVSLWHVKQMATQKRKNGFLLYEPRYDEYIFIIEQPELHIHPSFQAQFVDLLVQLIKVFNTSKVRIKFMIETHSDTIVNRIGFNIANKDIEQEHVSVYLVSKTNHITSARRSRYNSKGALVNWPIGFFSPDSV